MEITEVTAEVVMQVTTVDFHIEDFTMSVIEVMVTIR